MNKIFTIKKQNSQMLWGLDVPTEIPASTWIHWKWLKTMEMVSMLLATHYRIREPFLLWPQGWYWEFYQCIIVQYHLCQYLFICRMAACKRTFSKRLQSDIWLWIAVYCRYFQELGRVSPCVFLCLMNYGLVHPFRLSHIKGLSYQPICSCWLHQRIINIFFN